MAMTEKEKMLSGRLYDARGDELAGERLRARFLVEKFNNAAPDAVEERAGIAKELFGAMGDDCYLEPPLRCDYGAYTRLGNRVYGNFNLTILDCAPVTIGDDVMIGPNVGIYTAGHPVDPTIRKQFLEFALPITIEEGVWIGGHSVIAPGVTIGKNSVIGAGSVVVKDIPAGVVAAGNPCKVIRPITEKDREFYAKGRRVGEKEAPRQ